jgi:hypothetical protein
MKAIAIVPGTPGARIVERPEPSVSAPDDVKLRVIRVGICGTGRGELSGGTIAGRHWNPVLFFTDGELSDRRPAPGCPSSAPLAISVIGNSG